MRIIGFGEIELERALRQEGLGPELQRPCGKYNIDIAISSIAVEVFTPSNSWRHMNDLKRFKQLIKSGYTVIYIKIRNKQALLSNLQDIVAIIKQAYGDPPSRRKHRMIRCSFYSSIRTRNERNQFASIPAPIRYFYTVSELDLA